MALSKKLKDGIGDGGYFYLVAGNVKHAIYATNSDCVKGGILLAEFAGRSLEDQRPLFNVHAYGIDPHWIRAVVETTSLESPLDAFRRLIMNDRDLCDPRRRLGTNCALTVRRFVRLELEAEFLAAVRHCHRSPLSPRRPDDLSAERPDSHRAYMGLERICGLTRSTLARLLSAESGGWPGGYRLLMQAQESGHTSVQLLSMDVPILPQRELTGDLSCLNWLRNNHTASRTQRVFEQTVENACAETGCDSFEFRAHPSDPRYKLQRALIVHRLRENKVMSVKEAMMRLGCDRSWSYHTYRECLEKFPDVFRAERR
jgi:hypothetical protein